MGADAATILILRATDMNPRYYLLSNIVFVFIYNFIVHRYADLDWFPRCFTTIIFLTGLLLFFLENQFAVLYTTCYLLHLFVFTFIYISPLRYRR